MKLTITKCFNKIKLSKYFREDHSLSLAESFHLIKELESKPFVFDYKNDNPYWWQRSIQEKLAGSCEFTTETAEEDFEYEEDSGVFWGLSIEEKKKLILAQQWYDTLSDSDKEMCDTLMHNSHAVA